MRRGGGHEMEPRSDGHLEWPLEPAEARHETAAKALASALYRARIATRLSQEQVAHQAGISTDTYACMERGSTVRGTPVNPSFKTLATVLPLLGIPVMGHGVS